MTPESQSSSSSGGARSEARDTLKQDAGQLQHTIGERARQEAESRKGQAVHIAGSASSALDTAAQDLKDNPEVPDWMASALQQAARKIETLASHVDGRGVDELGREVSQFARRNPGTFLAASAAVGFAAARVMRAGMDRKTHDKNGTANQNGGQDTQTWQAGDEQGWAADENIMPTQSGDFVPAYPDTDSGMGGTTR